MKNEHLTIPKAAKHLLGACEISVLMLIKLECNGRVYCRAGSIVGVDRHSSGAHCSKALQKFGLLSTRKIIYSPCQSGRPQAPSPRKKLHLQLSCSNIMLKHIMYLLQLYVLPNLYFQGTHECYAAMVPSSAVQ